MARYENRQYDYDSGNRERSMFPAVTSHFLQDLPLSRKGELGGIGVHSEMLDEDPFWYEDAGVTDIDNGLDEYDRALLAEPNSHQRSVTYGSHRVSLPPKSAKAPVVNSMPLAAEHQVLQKPKSRALSSIPRQLEALKSVDKNSRRSRFVDQTPVSQGLFVPSSIFPSDPPSAVPSSSPAVRVSRRRSLNHQRRTQPEESKRDSTSTHALGLPNTETTAKSRGQGLVPTIQGISLVSTHDLPDRFRSVFPFQVFNAVQSRCFRSVYHSNNNLVLSAPTGSGKTVILELAICKLVKDSQVDDRKIVYVAPTKSLCSERHKDWEVKFKSLGLHCVELTGDTDHIQQAHAQRANLIITTPEKWDSITRKWKDQSKLMQLVTLFLIDEVHILKEYRGATLEAVVSRMKSTGPDLRFIALSATVPNSQDIAVWLGKSKIRRNEPAELEVFGEEFRPVRLQKHVVAIKSFSNDFAFDQLCDEKLPEIISVHSAGKPIIIFCSTRKSAEKTASSLARLWKSNSYSKRLWPNSNPAVKLRNWDLEESFTTGVAFHHAGLDASDRNTVEKAFLQRNIGVICCTSTLAVGVNLPCYLVIVKNTVSWQAGGLKEYSDLETIQMLGRAGRPQFDQSAVAVIITRAEKAQRYERLVAGNELLESCLHLNLIEHLNAEISLGTIKSLESARRWLSSTFFHVRLSQNPAHYKLKSTTIDNDLNSIMDRICNRDLELLQDTNLVILNGPFHCTEFGDSMARYCVKFVTMQAILQLPQRAKISEILSVLANADELHEVRLRSGEKPLFKTINSASGIKFPIPVDIALASHKRSLIMQAELGGVDYPSEAQFKKHRAQYQQDLALIFSNVHRLIRCIADCQLYLQDGLAMRHALELGRSLGARVWDNSPLQMKQILNIGPVAVRKLVQGGVNSIDALEATEAYRINSLLSKNPGFGEKLLDTVRRFPRLRVSLRMIAQNLNGTYPVIKFKAELGFLSEEVPVYFNRKAVYICFIAERSDGHLIDFKRIGAAYINKGDICLSIELLNESQYVTCYAMCDEIAGTLQYAELKPDLSSSQFLKQPDDIFVDVSQDPQTQATANISRRRSSVVRDLDSALDSVESGHTYSDNDLNDADFLTAHLDFVPIDDVHEALEHPSTQTASQKLPAATSSKAHDDKLRAEPRLLENGKWECNHNCKEKTKCKHLCCREGLEKPPASRKSASGRRRGQQGPPKKQPKPNTPMKRNSSSSQHFSNKSHNSHAKAKIATIDLSHEETRATKRHKEPLKSLDQLHHRIMGKKSIPILPRNKKDQRQNLRGLTPMCEPANWSDVCDEFGDDWMDDLPPLSSILAKPIEDDKPPAGARLSKRASRREDPNSGTRNKDTAHGETNSLVRDDLVPEKLVKAIEAESLGELSSPMHPEIEDTANVMRHADQPPLKPTVVNSAKRAGHSRGPSPAQKKRRTNVFEDGGGSHLGIAGGDAIGEIGRISPPFKDMEGIDLDLLTQFQGIVDFVE